MREPSTYPAGVPCWIDTAQPDAQAAADFYGGLFGWEFGQQSTVAGPYLVATMEGAPVAAITTATDGASDARWTSYMRVDSIDDVAAIITAAGGRTLVGPVDHADAGRRMVCTDSGGATFGVVQTSGSLLAQRVNEPGTWNFSELLTPTPDEAIDFYRRVFGWEADLVDLGTGDTRDTWMWRRPGYGDILEQHNPGIRERHTDFGAPPGFTDAVAWLSPSAAGSADAAPSWHITFAVADADATAARAEQLGGTVLVPPTDLGVVRTAVLRDPHGATFTASRFAPG